MAKHRSILGPGGKASPPTTQAQPTTRTVDIAPLSLRAEIIPPATANDETREVELVFSTGADVERYDWGSGKSYLERLSLDPKNIRLDRLNGGGPLLDSHSAWSVADMLGAVVPGSVTLTKSQARARVRFSRRPEVDGVWQDVKDGIVRSVSVGYRIYKYEETEGKGNKLPVRLATDWEPYEVSMVSMPADAGAAVRGQKPADTNRCEIVTANLSTRAGAAPSQPSQPTKEQKQMEPMETPEETRSASEYLVEEQAPAPTTETRATVPAEEPNERDNGANQERERIQGILTACRAARLPQSYADKLIGDPKMTLVRAQGAVFAEMSKRGRDEEGSRIPAAPRIEVGDDPMVHKRKGIENALLHRIAPDLRRDGKPVFVLEDVGREYRGLGLMDIARVFLNARGTRTTGMSKMDIAAAAFGFRGGMHTTSDFALLLADVQGKVLRAAYDEAPQTWRAIARDVILSDFKPSKQLQFGEAPALLEILEHGEYKSGTIGEGKEQFQLASYGRKFAITRKALINDDTDAFSRVPIEFGRAARRLESDLAWRQITSNPTMGDNNSLFDDTNHANYTSSGTAISVESLGVGRAKLRKQTGVDGVSLLNLSARYILVPAAKETLADQYTSANFVAAQAGNVNPFAGRLTPIAEPRLDAASGVSWYLAADPSQIDILLHGVLEGQEGPRIEQRVGFDVDGLEIKCGIDTAFKVADWRGLYKNAGA